jgi:hypothetical protein
MVSRPSFPPAPFTFLFTDIEGSQLYHCCEWSLELGRNLEAEDYGREALRIAAAIQDRQLIVYPLALLAATGAAQGRLEEAGALWGSVESEEGRGPVGQWEQERELHASRVLAHAGDEFMRGRVAGRRLPLAEAVELALQT